MLSRRQFLARSRVLTMAPVVPTFLTGTANAITASQRDDRALVIIQLDGGNDGINTVVPVADEGYAKHRQTLRLERHRLIPIDQEVSFHPAMRPAADLLEDGRLAVVQGVGYPNPDRSHFRSMPIWQTARFDENEMKVGWCGRALDAARADGKPDSVFVGPEKLPLTLRGQRCVAASMRHNDDLSLPPLLRQVKADSSKLSRGPLGDLQSFVDRTVHDSYATADRLAGAALHDNSKSPYPRTQLAHKLKLIARLLKADMPARVYYAIQPGYDTHVDQLATHASLLSEFAGATKAFLDDLSTAGLAKRAIVLAFSEFGRRVCENGSRGTDHGTAGPVFIAGDSVNAGVIGRAPSLTDLIAGDLQMHVDFRQVYATVLQNWLDADSIVALGQQFSCLDFLRTG